MLASSNDDGTIAWHENDGEESFTERVITTDANGARSAFAVDVDQDGFVDVFPV